MCLLFQYMANQEVAGGSAYTIIVLTIWKSQHLEHF